MFFEGGPYSKLPLKSVKDIKKKLFNVTDFTLIYAKKNKKNSHRTNPLDTSSDEEDDDHEVQPPASPTQQSSSQVRKTIQPARPAAKSDQRPATPIPPQRTPISQQQSHHLQQLPPRTQTVLRQPKTGKSPSRSTSVSQSTAKPQTAPKSIETAKRKTHGNVSFDDVNFNQL